MIQQGTRVNVMRKRLLIGAALMLITIGLSGCKGDAPDVALGTLERDRIEITARLSETIIEQSVTEGEQVPAGTPLLQLDPQLERITLQRLTASRDQAAAHLAELRRGPRAEQIARARAARDAAKLQWLDAQRHAQRLRELEQQQLASREQLESALVQRDTLHAELEQRAQLLTELQSGTTQEQLEQAEAALQAAQSRIAEQQLRLEWLTPRAPVNATVDQLPYQVGEQPPLGAVIAVLLSREAPYIRAYIPEPYRAAMVIGEHYPATIDGIAQPFSARLRTLSSEPAFTPHFALTEHDRSRLSYLAEFEIDHPALHSVGAGIPAQVTLRRE